MENRLELNKKPVYELPCEVLVSQYTRNRKKEDNVPDFEPNIIINNWGKIRISNKKKERAKQLWVKTEDVELINFIVSYNWKEKASSVSTPFLDISLLKKILLEEFYNK